MGSVVRVWEGEVTNHDAKGGPHLPLHNQSTAEPRGGRLGREHGYEVSVSLSTATVTFYLHDLRVVADTGPRPRPRAHLAMNRCHQESVRACHPHATTRTNGVRRL